MLKASGKQRLFIDADGSTPIEEYLRLLPFLNQDKKFVFASRALTSEDTIVETNLKRKLMGRCFNIVVNLLIEPTVKDTQCGFKLFSRAAASNSGA